MLARRNEEMMNEEQAEPNADIPERPRWLARQVKRIPTLYYVLGSIAAILAIYEVIVPHSSTSHDEYGGDATPIQCGVTIDTPKPGEVFAQGSEITMKGTLNGDIPTGSYLWVVARDKYNFFLMRPPIHVSKPMRKWSQGKVILATPGEWELHVCMANAEASEWCQIRANADDNSGFEQLPKGMESLRYITIRKQ
jgi:hypothetical protein